MYPTPEVGYSQLLLAAAVRQATQYENETLMVAQRSPGQIDGLRTKYSTSFISRHSRLVQIQMDQVSFKTQSEIHRELSSVEKLLLGFD
jgi:hypothetical protein